MPKRCFYSTIPGAWVNIAKEKLLTIVNSAWNYKVTNNELCN